MTYKIKIDVSEPAFENPALEMDVERFGIGLTPDSARAFQYFAVFFKFCELPRINVALFGALLC